MYKDKRIKIVKCPCNDSHCNTYGLSIGTFYQGNGFSLEEAQFIVEACNSYNPNKGRK